MKKLIVSVALAGLSALAWALPSLQQVETQIQQGHYAQAESMMREVVAAKPESARAHYIYAEILAHDGNLARAAEEAKAARQIDPDLKFTDAEKFRSFEATLQRAQAPAARTSLSPAPVNRPAQVAPAAVAPTVATSGLPSWVWLAGVAAIAFALWRFFSRSRATAAAGAALPASGSGAPAAMGPGGPPYGPGAGGVPYGPGYAPQRAGSGMLGVGLGAAGGLAAGMLAERMLHPGRDGSVERDRDAGTSGGFFDSPQGGSAGNDLENRPIDFGTGGNDWDAGSSDAGGSDGGGDGGGGGWD